MAEVESCRLGPKANFASLELETDSRAGHDPGDRRAQRTRRPAPGAPWLTTLNAQGMIEAPRMPIKIYSFPAFSRVNLYVSIIF